ncbi:phenylalanyl-tRNA synthetase, beta subunit [Thioflavicoccus mobilis 8321]|uniref:Phenylalanine--tRNA ligase beta subunit n=1 Tax=Thioflavicoccus mobilis 8321 TaxID=765912 RepID=L0H1S8_9GAMM|nr:phenylalanine--tRNA ligase subunit beta [Thioflavicoccus mobilis]AGA91529.1 phenylalanyl-tRNA synthetase, beta subunit [Thioflavicoccus mobilis 8321]
MRFSVAWLREWVDPPIDVQTLADQLSMAGLEVDAIEPAAPAFSGVVVGEVLALEPHPNADKLRVCTVAAGRDEALQIVCGAANVAQGMRVPVALVGAELPGGFKIKRAKLRGVESLGMICSAAELGLAESSNGILPLPVQAPVGEDLRSYLALDDSCIEVDLTPDRGDCLGLAGIAREVAAINRTALRTPTITPVAATSDERPVVRLEAPEACPRYAARVVRGIDPTAETPLWMRERLRRSGLRAIHPVVDVTNYVMLELGQPMHGFDLAQIEEGIRVRLARDGERLALLNGEALTLRGDSLVIADAERPLALAGIMGGEGSGVTAATRDVLLESAFFAPTAIAGRARSYGLHTDSSHRFERGVDPGLQVRALERATELLLAIAGGAFGPVVDCAVADQLPQRAPLTLRRQRIAQVLGLELDDAVVEDLLVRLGMEVAPVAEGWSVVPPSSRFDLVLEVDLIADLGRLYGYDRIPVQRACSATVAHLPEETGFDLERAKLALVERGYFEVITYSFVSPDLQALLDPAATPLVLANPLSAEMAAMRTSLWPGLLQAARQNLARQQPRMRLFESGLRFRNVAGELHQEPVLAGLLVGDVAPEQWGEPARAIDFYDMKGDLEALLRLTGCPQTFRFVSGELAALHPGQTARIEREGRSVGVAGMLHPAIAAQLDIAGDVFLFELELGPLLDGALPAFQPLSKFPVIRRDLALELDEAIPYERVHHCIADAAGALLRELVLFDVYRGDKITPGCKSLALGLILQASSQTLTDQEVDEVLDGVLARLAGDLGARLRS